MKKILILSTFLIVTIYLTAQERAAISSNGSGGGNWNSGTSWNGGTVPANGDDVTILSGDGITSTTGTDAATTITVNSGATLTINSGATLTTSGNLIIAGTLNQNGTCNAGDAVDDMFHINGGTFNVGNSSTTTIAGYYKQQYVDASNVGTIAASGGVTATVNIANAGVFNDNTNNIFYFDNDCVSSLTGQTVNINILHGNTGTADEVFIGVASGVNPGLGTTTIGNGSNTTSAWSMVNNSSFGKIKLDIGSGNTMLFSHTVDRTTNTVVFFGLDITSGTFKVESGSGLKIVNNNQLIVGSSGALVLEADATGTGELIFYDDANDVTATISRYIVGNEWHQISPSTTGSTADDIFQNYNPNVWLMEWAEGTQSWEYITDKTTALPVGQGYAVYGEQLARVDDFTVSYSGNMRDDDFVVSQSLGSNEFTLVGNPFSSSVRVIEGVAGLGGSSNTGFWDEIWIWNPSTGQYATFTGGTGGQIMQGIVAQGQGYFVKSLSGWSGSATFTMYETERRFGSTSNFLKSSGTIDWDDNHGIGEYVMLKVTDGNTQDGVFVNFGEFGTPGIENNYDGFKRKGDATSPQLYLVEGDNELTIDYLQTLQEAEERIVKMNFEAGQNGEHTIAANLDSLLNVKVTLEDSKTGIMHEFNSGEQYTFNASTDDASDRFLLHFMYSATGIEDPADDDSALLNIYAYNKAVYISNADNAVQSTIFIYDLMGREVYSNNVELGSYTRIPVNVNNTYLIVKVIKGNDVVTQKVFIQ